LDAADADAPFRQRLGLYSLVLLPPLAVAVSDPSLFFALLDTAGTYGILVLFGIMPAAMAWVQRYAPGAEPEIEPALPGGRPVLFGMAVVAGAVVAGETWERMSGLA
jgi:tyrosine-specific transport protein